MIRKWFNGNFSAGDLSVKTPHKRHMCRLTIYYAVNAKTFPSLVSDREEQSGMEGNVIDLLQSFFWKKH